MKRRSLAKELCEEGAVLVNGRPARAGRDLAPGDEITLRLRSRLLSVQVSELPERPVSASRAHELYRLILDERPAAEDLDEESGRGNHGARQTD